MKIAPPFSKMSTLYKLILSLSGLVIIPVVIIGSFFYKYNFDNIKTNVEQISQYQLVQIKNSINQQYKQHLIIARKLGEDPIFNPNRLSGTLYERYEALMSFRKHTISYNYSEYPYLYLRGENLLYSQTGISNFNTIAIETYGFSDVDAFQEWLEDVNRPSTKRFETDLGTKIVFQYPMYQSQTTLLFIMNYDELIAILNNITADIDGISMIFDRDGEIIADSIENEEIKNQLIGVISEIDYDNIIKNVDLSNDSYSLITTYSDSTDWIFVVGIPESAFTFKTQLESNILFLISICVLILGVTASVILSIFHYRPLKRVMGVVGGFSRKGNEYEQISQVYIDSIKHSDKLQQILDFQAPYALDRMYERLLFSNISSDELAKIEQRVYLTMNEPWFYVMVFTTAGKYSTSDRYLFCKKAIEIASKQSADIHGTYSFYCMESIGENNLILIVNMRFPDSLVKINNHFIHDLRSSINIHMEILCGCGNIYKDIRELRLSLYEANTALEYNISYKKDSILLYNDIPHYDKETATPNELNKLYFQQVKHGDINGSLESLDKIFLLIRKEDCFEVERNRLIDSLTEISNIFPLDNLNTDLEELGQISQLVQFENQLKDLTVKLCSLIGDNKKLGSLRLKNNILLYIKNNYHDPDMGLDSIGENFGFSPSYLSRFIREQTGHNIKDYISRIRIDEAKRLILETDLSINDIVERVGYYNSSSFIRKFRKIEGMTPGAFRDKATE